MRTLLRKIIFITLGLLFFLNTYSQDLLHSRKSSYYTYIYKLSPFEAKQIYKKQIDRLDTNYFHTLVDSFPTDNYYKNKLPVGYYLKTYSVENKQQVDITSVQDFDVFILNNNMDLYVQVTDLQGIIISEAKVKAGNKRLHFNKKAQSYIDKKSNKRGLLTVKYKGFTAYYNLSRDYNNTFARKIIYGPPLRYIWVPVDFILSIPLDGIKSATRGYPYGSIYKIKRFAVNTFNRVACIFDDYYCYGDAENRFKEKYSGYIVFNKPKYKPGDTVRFKAYLVKKKKKPVKKPVNVVLQKDYYKQFRLTSLDAYKDGAYQYEFYLHDSLQLTLDKDYFIKLQKNENKTYLMGRFKYEDYELSKSMLSIRTSQNRQYKDRDIKLYVKGTDENDLNLQDARIEVLLTPTKIHKYFNDYIFVPDTLLFVKKGLAPQNETEITVNDSLFPHANFDYKIEVTLRTSDNEVIKKTQNVRYFYEQRKFQIKLPGDSVLFEYYENGLKTNTLGQVFVKDYFGNTTLIYEGEIPYKTKLTPYYAYYIVKSKNQNLSASITIANQPALLNCYAERTHGKISIQVDNPRKLPFTYNIYKKNRQKYSGYTDSLEITKTTKSKQNYFVSIRYIWGGREAEDFYTIPLNDKKLNIKLNQPKLVYPGQKTRIELLITDFKGKPVENVDLTAFSLTKKFHYAPPSVPQLGKPKKLKKIHNNFQIDAPETSFDRSFILNYEYWKKLAKLDTIEYYKFLYPKNKIYRFEYETGDTTTQFAPFVISNGEIVPVHVIYVDSKPVYFSWSNNIRPYSFEINPGYHSIKLRTTYKEYSNDRMFFEKGKKTIFSIDEASIAADKDITDHLSHKEQNLLYNYIFPYRDNFGDEFAYLENSGKIIYLRMINRQFSGLAGPVSGDVHFHLIGNYTTNFHHEPYFEYDFAPGLLKMRSVSMNNLPKNLQLYKNTFNLNDKILTVKYLEEKRKEYLFWIKQKKAVYSYPEKTEPKVGHLSINFKRNKQNSILKPLHIILTTQDNRLINIYPGSERTFYNLSSGYYRLIFIYYKDKYSIIDSLYVKTNGNNHHLIYPEIFEKDSIYNSFNQLVEFHVFGNVSKEKNKTVGRKSKRRQVTTYTGPGKTITGIVYDVETKEMVPGVSIVVKNFDTGTITDINGYYSITVPEGASVLKFSFIGYNSQNINIGFGDEINVGLSAAEVALDELVVTAFGVSRSNKAYTVSEVSGEYTSHAKPVKSELQGKVAGINVTGSGKTEIRIRGANSILLEQPPLYIIDGKIFTGEIKDLNPDLIKSIEILKAEKATALYGTAGANGVVIIQTKSGNFKLAGTKNKGADYDDAFYEQSMQASSIRKNFSDYAFWQPALSTDKNGKASFEVTFPDDITNWETFYMAMGKKRLSGQTQSSIKSYKPLMAQLALPRFLVLSDSAFAIGKSLNYTPDSVEATTQFEINDRLVFSKKQYFKNAVVDTLPFTAFGDTISLKYFLKKDDGYFDGELRKIPVFPLGLKETKGGFHVLENDTNIVLNFNPEFGKIHIDAKMNALNILWDEINFVRHYRYLCSEQLASKLRVLLAAKTIKEGLGQEFKYDKDIRKVVKLLKKRQKKNGMWGWWENSNDSYWITKYVLESLSKTQKYNYQYWNYDEDRLTKHLVWRLEDSQNIDNSLKILETLTSIEAKINYDKYISKLGKAIDTTKTSLNTLLRFIHLKQSNHLEYSLDTIEAYRNTTLFGNVYFSDNSEYSNLNSNNIQNTIFAYKIYRNDTVNHNQTLSKIRNYFFEQRGTRSWRNTYESAQIIETILPDLLKDSTGIKKPELTITQDSTIHIVKFPFKTLLEPGETVTIKKSGTFPVYLSTYQQYWNTKPKTKKSEFEISTHFNTISDTLTGGEPVTLIVDLLVKKDAEYVMINIPIPGGCSYGKKETPYGIEDHREYFKNETAIFCSSLSKGKYTFEIKLIPRYTGKYTLNPAKVELMYFPVFNANNELKKVAIKK